MISSQVYVISHICFIYILFLHTWNINSGNIPKCVGCTHICGIFQTTLAIQKYVAPQKNITVYTVCTEISYFAEIIDCRKC